MDDRDPNAVSVWGRGHFTATDSGDEGYYREHAAAGLDYLEFGDWHRRYAAVVTAATLQTTYVKPAVLDVGCACGPLVMALGETGVYRHALGLDPSEHMIRLGRHHFGVGPDVLLHAGGTGIPLSDATLTLINSGQVLEHVDASEIDAMFAEFWRVLRPGGRMFHNLSALKHGDPPDLHDGDPTHVNVKPTGYWAERFAKAGFVADFESYDRFVRAKPGPDGSDVGFFDFYPIWTSFALRKPEG